MEAGSINGIAVWVKSLENVTNERTVIKEAPGVDGAVVEVQGQAPQRWSLEFTLIRDGQVIVDDYETATLDLRSMFLSGGPFTLVAPAVGELTDLWIGEQVSLRFYDESRLFITEGSVSFVEARPFPILQDSAAGNVSAAIAALSAAAVQDFGSRAPDTGFLDGAVNVLDAISAWLVAVQGAISSAFQSVSNFAAAIDNLANNTEALLNAPQNFASDLLATASGLLSLIPSLSKQGDKLTGSAAVQDDGTDKPAVVFIGALESGTDFDADVPTPQGEIVQTPSEEDLAELDEMASATSLSLTAVTLSVCLAVTSTNFATINSVLELADALEPPFEKLFALEGLDYRVYVEAVALRAATRLFLSELAVGLPRLRNYTAEQDTDIFSLLVVIYDSLGSEANVQAAVDSIFGINTIPDPLAITRGTTLRYLDPLV